MDKKELFLNKYCKLEKKSGFVLNGRVIDVTDFGIIFQTLQATSFISWNEILEILPISERMQ
jgi:hypothetical protein